MNVSRTLLITVAGLLVSLSSVVAAEPSWLGTIVARGPLRQQIEATPILDRPYRPLHFYGNTVRREFYRGTAVPTPRDFVQGMNAFVTRRN